MNYEQPTKGIASFPMWRAGLVTSLGPTQRVWAVGAVHGEKAKLGSVLRQIKADFQAGDRVVFLGNHHGYGEQVKECVDEILLFRRWVMAKPGGETGHVVILRGAQEEMWQKLLQLQMTTDPFNVLQWMLDHGTASAISSYGASPQEGLRSARDGALTLTRWTNALRQLVRQHDGHFQLMSALSHAAAAEKLLFVSASINPAKEINDQGDLFWWGNSNLADMVTPYSGFNLVVHGLNRRKKGILVGDYALSLDGGAGLGGKLVAACLDSEGKILIEIEG